MLRAVRATRYVRPFRAGGSVPVLVEADDLGLYVVKLTGAGQGPLALVAEVVAGAIGRAVGLAVPEIVLVETDRDLARAELDPEIAEPLARSAGTNLGLDYLPGSLTWDPARGRPPDPETASRVVLFDALVTNVDRTARNVNVLAWHARLWLIDHGAALYRAHGSSRGALPGGDDPFPEVRHHVLLPWASALPAAAVHLARTLDDAVIAGAVADVPAAWLAPEEGTEARRAAYASWLRARVEAIPRLLEEAARARADLPSRSGLP